jgi:hypothetical protein
MERRGSLHFGHQAGIEVGVLQLFDATDAIEPAARRRGLSGRR